MNEAQEIQQFIQALISALQQAMESGEVLSDELQGEIAKTLQFLVSKLDQISENPVEALQAYEPQKPPPPGGPSSNVAGSEYDPKTKNLKVQFLGKHPNRNGPIYQYPNTPPVIAELIQSGAIPARTNGHNAWGSWFKGKVPSAGASVFTLLKERGAPYQRLS